MVKAYLLETPAFNAFRNMALDEALFGEKFNVLRFYQWEQPSYSVGYFQKIPSNPGFLPMVRRLTGGGTVLHDQDLTFSMVLNINDFPDLKILEDSYYLIHRGLWEGLRKMGMEADMVGKSLSGNGAFCFQSPVRGDLILGGRKIAGGAQRRKTNRLLYQGTLQMIPPGTNLIALRQAVALGLSHVFGFDFVEWDVILAGLETEVKNLEMKYRSEKWTNRF